MQRRRAVDGALGAGDALVQQTADGDAIAVLRSRDQGRRSLRSGEGGTRGEQRDR
jgi:hypothetical protein